MTFIWVDGHTSEVEFGGMIRGIKHGHFRPEYLHVTKSELLAPNGWARGRPEEDIKRYIYSMLMPSVADTGSVHWIDDYEDNAGTD